MPYFLLFHLFCSCSFWFVNSRAVILAVLGQYEIANGTNNMVLLLISYGKSYRRRTSSYGHEKKEHVVSPHPLPSPPPAIHTDIYPGRKRKPSTCLSTPKSGQLDKRDRFWAISKSPVLTETTIITTTTTASATIYDIFPRKKNERVKKVKIKKEQSKKRKKNRRVKSKPQDYAMTMHDKADRRKDFNKTTLEIKSHITRRHIMSTLTKSWERNIERKK